MVFLTGPHVFQQDCNPWAMISDTLRKHKTDFCATIAFYTMQETEGKMSWMV